MKLGPGEIKCDQCKEAREKRMYDLMKNRWKIKYDIWCDKCKGTGKLDWIENVVGKKYTCELWFAPTAGYRRGTINATKTR